eukprot:1157902-Pelagomonas_calceolata.AAC.15
MQWYTLPKHVDFDTKIILDFMSPHTITPKATCNMADLAVLTPPVCISPTPATHAHSQQQPRPPTLMHTLSTTTAPHCSPLGGTLPAPPAQTVAPRAWAPLNE